MSMRRTVVTISAAAAICFGLAAPAANAPNGKADLGSSDQPTDYTLRLGETSFDPLVEAPAIPEEWSAAQHDGADLRLVQVAGPTRAEWLDDLRDAGLTIIRYVHPHTYVVWGEAQSLEASRNLEPVRWSGEFHPAYRVQPQWRDLPEQPVDAKVIVYRGADVDAIVREISALGGRSTGRLVLDRTFEIAGFAVPGSLFAEIARIPGVYCVRPTPTDGGLRGEMSDQVCAGNYDAGNLAFPGYQDWLATVGLDGSGVIIANVDGGVQDSHPDLVARMIACTGLTCGGGASSSHGTHTAGTMAGDGTSGVMDSFGFLRGLGIAPGANLVEQVYSPWYSQPGGMILLMRDSFNNGASLSGNSWGPSGSPLGYDDDTMQVDIGSRDTDPNTPGDQPLLFVLSFMNGNGGVSSQGTPDEAKNIFTVGSTWMQFDSGSQMLNIDDVSSNSAHGPALDGRKIPHIVAPGCQVDSTVPGGHGVSGWCGTSMASPHVSGAVGLFIEHYRGRPDYTVDPSPAMIKAAFLPVAHNLSGHNDADNGTLGHPFDSKQGWGRLNLPPVIDPPAGSVRYFDNPVVLDNTGEEWSVNLSPLDPGRPIRIMLVWTDAAGHGLGGSTPAWNNDLDLIVEAGATYLGNNFGADGWSAPGGAADFRNNTEGVFLGPTPPGNVTVRVVAANINSDGLPNSGDDTDQDFALVAYNAAEEPGFTIVAGPSSMDACAPDDAVYSLEIGQILGYEEAVTLSAGAPSGTTVVFADNPVTPPAATTMTISGTGGASAGDYSIDITGTTVDLTRNSTVGLGLFTATPGIPDTRTPPDGAIDVSVAPTFMWDPSPQTSTYLLDVAIDAAFGSIVYSATVEETSHAIETSLDANTPHYWRVRGGNACGDSAYWVTFTFTTQDVPSILLVDDDDNSPDVRSSYTSALDALGLWYDVWDTNNSDIEPSASSPYRVVIWFTGDEYGGSSGPGGAGESALSTWLDGGGCLFMSSQDYYWDRGLTTFMAQYLGVSSCSSDVSQTTVTGAGTVFGSIGSYALSYPFTNYSDAVNPAATAEVAFTGNAGSTAVSTDRGNYRATFWGFPLEAIPDTAERADLLGVFLDWCGGLVVECPQDLDGNGSVGFEDLLATLAAWGPCVGCPADFDGNGNVGFEDLLALLAAWGPCE